MVLKKVLTLATFLAGAALAEAPRPGEATLPLADYLTLVDRADALEKEKRERDLKREPNLAEVVDEKVEVELLDKEAKIATSLEILVQGEMIKPVDLAISGFVEASEVKRLDGKPNDAANVAALSLRGDNGGLLFIAPNAGRYRVEAKSRLALNRSGGIVYLSLVKTAAPVAATTLDMPADLDWKSTQATIAEEKVVGERRRLRLASRRGEPLQIELKRRLDDVEEEKVVAQAVVLTLIQLQPEGPKRHDVVYYEVQRGQLGRLEVELPVGLEIDEAATDEGLVLPTVDNGRLVVARQRQLQGAGYLVLTSTPAEASVELGWSALKVPFEVRARYLAISSSVAATLEPQPAANFAQVDLEDLPNQLRDALQAIDLAAAWRHSGPDLGARLAVAALPAAPQKGGVIERRETTTLLTVDGTLLHREVFALASAEKWPGAFELRLAAGATLWSTKVAGQAIRPLERAGKIVLPLGLASGAVDLEVVSVLERATPAGRSLLELGLAEVEAPVLEHRWRVLLPEGPRYRLTQSELSRAPADSGGFTAMRSIDQVALPSTRTISVGGSAVLNIAVTDSDGQALPGVSLTLSSRRGDLSVGATSANGSHQFAGLPGGSYEVRAELDGFSSAHADFFLEAGAKRWLELQLHLASVAEAIMVSPELQTSPRRRDTVSPEVLEDKDEAAKSLYGLEVQNLQQGLVGGVKPLPISIPEKGKALYLTGILPPTRVTATLEVKAKR